MKLRVFAVNSKFNHRNTAVIKPEHSPHGWRWNILPGGPATGGKWQHAILSDAALGPGLLR